MPVDVTAQSLLIHLALPQIRLPFKPRISRPFVNPEVDHEGRSAAK